MTATDLQKGSLCWRLAVLTLGLVSGIACGPELTAPSSTDISGEWTSPDVIGPVSNIQVDVVQHAGGALDGRWSGKSTAPDAVCPPELGLDPTNSVSGTNTVLEVQLQLIGIGQFEGQAVDKQTLRGSLESCGQIYPMTFSRALATVSIPPRA